MTPCTTSALPRLALLAVSTGLAVGVALWGYSKLRTEQPTGVWIVDRSEEFSDELNKRVAEANTEDKQQELQLLPDPKDREAFAEFMRGRVPKSMVFDPILYMRRPANMSKQQTMKVHPKGGWEIRTNNYGMRNDRDVALERPALRVLVTGDSHTEGMCSNSESFSGVLETNMSATRPAGAVEVLNAGVGNYNPFHYLGVVERYVEELRPHVMVIAVYGGNDFAGAIKLQRFFSRRGRYESEPHVRRPYTRAMKVKNGMVSQELNQVLYFMNNPADEGLCSQLMIAISKKMASLCAGADVVPLFVYIPPATYAQPDLHRDLVATLTTCDAMTEVDIAVSERIADRWLTGLTAAGLEAIDMRGVYRETAESAYWEGDRHINLLGQRLVAEALEPKIRSLLNL